MPLLFKKYPKNLELHKILLKMANSLGLKDYTKNQILTVSSLKYLNLGLEFYLLKDRLSEFYSDDIIEQKFKNDDLESIFDVYNDFFELKELVFGDYIIQNKKNTKLNFDYIKPKNSDNKANFRSTYNEPTIKKTIKNENYIKLYTLHEYDIKHEIKALEFDNVFVLKF